MKTHDYVHRYRGYWSDGGKCRIRIYQEEGQKFMSGTCAADGTELYDAVKNEADSLYLERCGSSRP